jgi:beta-lactamase class A
MRLMTLTWVAAAACAHAELTTTLAAQTPLHQQLTDIANDARGTVSVACALPGTDLDCALNPHGHPPMQSVFKFPLAIAVLQQVEAGKLTLNQPVHFALTDRYPGTYSPLQTEHPDANIDVPLRELLRLSVSFSDNVATDILIRTIGGTQVVQHSLDELGVPAIHVRDTESAMHDKTDLQYRNDAEPAAMVALLRRLTDQSPLNSEHTALLARLMTETTSGPHRIKALLPGSTVVTHKTGSSGERGGFAPASNDVALITLPNGKRLALAIFVTDAHADDATRDSVIARIAKAIYDAAIEKSREP